MSSTVESLKNIARRVVPRGLRTMRLKIKGPYVEGPLTYNQDGLASRHNCDFMRDPRFVEAYRLGEATGSWRGSRIHWRAHVVFWAAESVQHLEGDFVECGVNRGGLSRAIASYIDFSKTDKTFWLLDTFQGLSDRYVTDEEKARGLLPGREGGYTECYEDVRRTFQDFKVQIIRGTVPDTLSQVTAQKVCYLSIDMNCVEPEIAAANFFWDKMVPGAKMVLDDYGWSACIAQKRAFDAFARERGVPLLALPTGQGLIIKP